ncbi:ATP-binding protein [Brevundimonas naejangsanensis]
MVDQLAFDFSPPRPELPQLWTPDDIWRALDQQTVQQFAEDHRIERKSVRVQPRALGDYLSMWANTQPHGGLVVIGVEDDGRLSGCKGATTEHLNALETARRYCPDARHEFQRVAVTNSDGEADFVLVARVYYNPSKLAETTDGNAFIREGDEKRSLTEQEKREIRLSKGELDFESELVPVRYPEDLDMDLVRQFASEYSRKRTLKHRKSLEDILLLAKLGRRVDGQFRPNMACALLFALDPRIVVPGAYIRIIRYEGTSENFGKKLNSIYDRVLDGPLPLQLLEAEQALDSQMRSFTRLGLDGRFVTRPEYPKDVWLEALVNAVVHRSYNLRHMNIFIKMFEDRIVVESPGLFMPPTTSETVYEAHNPRNPNLMWALYYFDFVKCAFEGTRRMREGMREAKLPDPAFSQKREGAFQVQVTLQNDVEHRKAFIHADVADVLDEETYVRLSPHEKMVINALADTGSVNVTEAGLLLDVDWRIAKGVLDSLEAKDLLARDPGNPRNRHRRYSLARQRKQ